ncbi:DUF4235 domain-containing protein [Conexibacter sp. W3-3-2]|uniref:DUF4235 domain-containing protein n=1 Tax=Paraconexibacter algicola TaxID=2133960 RepID=A0A2T4ULV8_9ACTN|nr:MULTISPECIES: DUF4235 domain-containing protein [Solirubrobacterales]MTD46555.1 DUF4235 domain-containing protein [Conexibacter sp. W3-3-2]PTL60195.1 hypothetical protein C7Y72_11385 [Paraconexibacter algicola]
MGRLLYKPFGIVFSVLAGKIAAKLFTAIWAALDKDASDGRPPRPTEPNAPVGKAIAATAIEAATYAGTRAAFDRAGVRTFHYLTGVWAGPKPPKSKR